MAQLIIKRGMKSDERCQLCGGEEEDINHVLFTCHIARQVWAEAGIPSPQFGFSASSIFANLSFLFGVKKLNRGSSESIRTWPWILWILWKSRNEFLSEGKR